MGRIVRLLLFGAVLATMGWATVVAVARGLTSSLGLLEAIAATCWSLVPFLFAACGALIVRKHSSNWVGWVLVVPGVAILQELMPILRRSSPPASLGALGIAQIWFSNISWLLLIFAVFHLLQVFPDGRLLSARWRVLVGLEATMAGSLAVLSLLSSEIGPLDGNWTVANPIGFVSLDSFEGAFELLWAVGLTTLTVGAVSAVALRFRRGTSAERQQIKWLLLAVSIFALAYISISANEAWQGQGIFDLVLVLSLMGIPVAILISVTRYHLYEIDRIISRTVAYVVVVSMLGLLYGGLVAVVGSLFEDSLVVALSTLVVAALFTPLRRRVQAAVDRRFNRSRYNAEVIVQDFTRALAGQVRSDSFVDDWLDVVTHTMGPEGAAVWVKSGEHESRA